MKDLMKYKDYFGTVHYSDEDEVFYGKLAFIRSLVTYEGTDVKSLKEAFYEAVDDYIETCENQGIKPEKPCRGSFNVRIGEELHCLANIYAMQHDTNLNKVVINALESFIVQEKSKTRIVIGNKVSNRFKLKDLQKT
ncbi:MAG: HicB family protein [uncultured bacterium]|nr:MAG: HicB family protein [uncultured bacterium]